MHGCAPPSQSPVDRRSAEVQSSRGHGCRCGLLGGGGSRAHGSPTAFHVHRTALRRGVVGRVGSAL
eukprot:3286753-Lingulodinium_polyedra.AAC.1